MHSFFSQHSLRFPVAALLAGIMLFFASPGSVISSITEGNPPIYLTQIYGHVWNDITGNGLQDSGEQGIGGTTVQLYQVLPDNTAQFVGQNTSDANGDFAFILLPPPLGGTYYFQTNLQSLLEKDYVLIPKDHPSPADVFDSDFDQQTGQTDPFVLFQSRLYQDWDLGLVKIGNCNTSQDIVISFDSSGNISSKNFALMMAFIGDIARSFQFGQAKTRIGVVQFNATGWHDDEVSLNQFDAVQDFIEHVNGIDRITQVNATDIWEALHFPQVQFDLYGRINVAHSIILITDGDYFESRPVSEVYAEADRVKKLGTQIFVLKLTNTNPDTLQLSRSIATKPSPPYLFTDIGDQSYLVTKLADLVMGICSPPESIPERNYYTVRTPVLTWNPINSAVGYEVQVSYTQDFSKLAFDSSITQTDVQTTPLPDGKYFWRVRALFNGDNWGNWSISDTFMIDGS